MKGRVLVASMLLLFAADAFANNMFIPNYYRNRRAVNQFSAVGWSNRHEVGAHYTMGKSENTSNGTATSDDENSGFDLHTFYRTNMNLNIEATIDKNTTENSPKPTGASTDTDHMDYHLGLGYEVEGMPWAFGLTYASEDADEEGTGGTDEKSGALGLGVGHALGDGMYVGFGWTYTDAEEKVGTAAATTDKDNKYHLGVGKVYGDRANPMAASEATLAFENEAHTQYWELAVKGLYNMDAFQYYGEIGYDWSGGDKKTKGYDLTVGADLLFGMFYIGPEIMWMTTSEDLKPSGETETDMMVLGLEAGYRTEMVEAFVRYSTFDYESETSPNKSKVENNTWVLGASYHF